MELWIRSQDRTKLVKADNISYMDTAEDYERKVHSLWNDCKGILGIYKTKERALEILDEIQEFIEDKEKSNIEITSDEINQSITYPKIVYEMPKE